MDTEVELMNEIKNLMELETRKLLVDNARFNRIVLDDYDQKVKLFEDEFDAKISFYGEKQDKFIEKKQELLKQYKDEFDKVYQKRKAQFFAIQAEIAEIQANQKIAIANFKKFEEYKKVYAKSQDYVKFIERKNQLEYMISQAQTIDEANNYQQALNKMKNPVEDFQGKADSLVEKYNEYDLLVSKCENKLEECIKATLNDFNNISLKHENMLVKATKQNKLFGFINAIINLITGQNRFEKNVIQKYKSKLEELSLINKNSIKNIESQTMSMVVTINQVRDQINEEFMRNAG